MTEATASSNQIIGTDTGNSDGSSSASGVGVFTPDVAKLPPSYSGTKHKIDFDGQEIELDYDTLVDEFKKNTKKAYQLEQKFNPMQQFIESLQKGDLSALRNVVPRELLREFSERELLEYIEEQQMDPREREFRDRERKLAEWESRQKASEEAENKRQYEAQLQRANDEVQRELASAVQELVGDAKVTPRFLRRVAERLYANMENGRELRGSDAAKMEWKGLSDDYMEYQQTMLRKDPQGFIASLPPEIIKAIRQHELAATRPLRAVEHKKDEEGYVPEKRLGVDDTFKAMDRYYEKKRKQQNRG